MVNSFVIMSTCLPEYSIPHAPSHAVSCTSRERDTHICRVWVVNVGVIVSGAPPTAISNATTTSVATRALLAGRIEQGENTESSAASQDLIALAQRYYYYSAGLSYKATLSKVSPVVQSSGPVQRIVTRTPRNWFRFELHRVPNYPVLPYA